MIRALDRVARMPATELRFRLQCEARKVSSRMRAAASRPRWKRAQLAALLEPGHATDWSRALSALERKDYLAAHRALADYWQQRDTPFPLTPARLPHVVESILTAFPDARARAVEKATAISGGRYDLLGYRDLAAGPAPTWHRDPVSGRESPLLFWTSLNYLDPALGDHKVIWELNRHQHWLTLGRAHALSGDRRFYATFTSQLIGWMTANPPHMGTNWASMLELAFRVISWLWSAEMFAAAVDGADRDPWLVDMLLGADRQLAHIEANLSRYFSPNTHFSGEALGLYVAGLALPELKASRRRAALGREVLVQEAARQLRADGGHIELSLHYHRYSTDFYLLAALVARDARDPAGSVFEDAVRRQAHYLRAMVDDKGARAPIGDDDGGQLFPICGRDPADCRDTLASAALLLDEPALAIDAAPEEAYWLFGPDAARDLSNVSARWRSAALPASGYFVSRTADADHLIFDAGPHGFLNGGHAHADALSCVLTIAGRPLLVDPGTATYTLDSAMRDRFRSPAMHNTVVLDGQPWACPSGPFHWSSRVDAHASIWQSVDGCDYAEGTHDSYLPRRHTRAVLAIHGIGWWIVDHVLGPGTSLIETFWHLHPAWGCEPESTHVIACHAGDRSLALASTAPLSLVSPGSDPSAAWSPAYGVVEPAPVVVGRVLTTLPATVTTFIPAAGFDIDRLSIQSTDLASPPGSGWHGAASEVRTSRATVHLLAAIESDGVAGSELAAPDIRWGTASLHTDGRVAALIEHVSRPAEAVIVNGSLVGACSEAATLNGPRTGVNRWRMRPVAPRVHELETAKH